MLRLMCNYKCNKLSKHIKLVYIEFVRISTRDKFLFKLANIYNRLSYDVTSERFCHYVSKVVMGVISYRYQNL